MSVEFGAVGRRGRAEIERLAGLYLTSGMRRSEFCRSHGLGLSTLTRCGPFPWLIASSMAIVNSALA
jgi:hypothetical protein